MRSSLRLLFALACVTPLTVALVALPGAPAFAQESADGNLEQQIYAALIKADFDPDNIGPETRSAIRAWQRDNGYEATGILTIEQLRSLRTKAPPIVTVEPKCAALPGPFLGEKNAECWVEAENQRGCFVWRTHYHSDQTTRWTGPCQSGVANGQGTCWVSAGSEHPSYEGVGMMENGKASGQWVENWGDGGRSEGEYRDGKRDGYWTITSSEGAWYRGDYRDDRRTGDGYMRSNGGNEYIGEFRDGLPHGQGSYFRFPIGEGDVYEGQWRNGQQHGYGTGYYSDGGKYEGEFRDGMRNGSGTYTWNDGNRYEGQWRDNKRHGFGTHTFTFSGGTRYEGQWRDDKPHGYGTYIKRGTRFQGTWHAGCFEDRGGWAALMTTAAECGFK